MSNTPTRADGLSKGYRAPKLKVNGLRTKMHAGQGNPRKDGRAAPWHGLSLWTIARKADVDISTVSRVRNRVRRPSFDVATRLAGALGITLEQLFIELNSMPRRDDRLPADYRMGQDGSAHAGKIKYAARDASVEVQPDDLHARALASSEPTADASQSAPPCPGN